MLRAGLPVARRVCQGQVGGFRAVFVQFGGGFGVIGGYFSWGLYTRFSLLPWAVGRVVGWFVPFGEARGHR